MASRIASRVVFCFVDRFIIWEMTKIAIWSFVRRSYHTKSSINFKSGVSDPCKVPFFDRVDDKIRNLVSDFFVIYVGLFLIEDRVALIFLVEPDR